MKPIRILLLILLISFLTTQASGQNLDVAYPHVEVMTPEAAKLAQYSDVPVSYYTGIPEISIPIYTIDVSGYKIPITLSYHASGIRVSEEATWVGLGWSLSAGGMVSRTVNGTDDFLEKGWDRAYPYVTAGYYYAPRFNTDYSQLYDSVSVAETGITLGRLELHQKYDTEPDIFFYSLPNCSGKFILDKDKGAVLFNKSDNIKVEILSVSQPTHIVIKITDSQGNQYLFERECASLNYATNKPLNHNGTDLPNVYDDTDASYTSWEYNGAEEDYDVGHADPYEMTTSWLLTEIKTNRNRCIHFEYEKETQYLPAQESCEAYNTHKHGRELFYYKSKLVNHSWRLAKIKWDFGTVTFIPEAREDIKGDCKCLRFVVVSDADGNPVRNVSFDYNYFNNNYSGDFPHVFKRLRLDAVHISSAIDGSTEGKYTFEYYPGDFPAKNSKNVDYWGYQNGRNYGRDYCVGVKLSDTVSYPGVTKNANIEKTVIGTLQQINYPTGGFARFTYEGNDVGGYFNSITNNDLGEDKSKNYDNITFDEYHVAVFCNYKSDEHPELPETDTLLFKVDRNMYVDISGHLENHNSEYKDPDYGYHSDCLLTITDLSNENTIFRQECPYLFERSGRGSVSETGEGCEYDVKEKRTQLFAGKSYKLLVNKPPKDVSCDWTIHFGGKIQQLREDGTPYTSSNNSDTNKKSAVNYGAGLRIKEIKTNINTRTFRYSQGKILSNPVLWYFKRRIGDNEMNPEAVVQTSESKTPFSTFGNGNFIGYDYVTESMVSGDNDFFITHKFINEEETEQFDDNFPDSPFLIRYDNGLPLETTYNENGDDIMSCSYEYETRHYDRIYALRDKSQKKLTDSMLPYFYDIEWPLTCRKSTIINDDGGTYYESESYKYNDRNIMNAMDRKCGNTSISTRVRYATDYNMPVYRQMTDSNIVAVPIESIKLKDGKVISGSKVEYAYNSGMFLPQRLDLVKTAKGLQLGDYSYYYQPEIKFTKYDSHGNPTEIVNKDITVSYLWQNNGEALAAQIENIGYSQLCGILGDNANLITNRAYESADELKSLLKPVINYTGTSAVKYYTYKHLKGISSSTATNGCTTYYKYDGLGRLKEIDDNNKKVTARFYYHYQTK